MDDSEDDAGRNRRETPPSVIYGREARALVAPVQDKVGIWQAETIKLETMAQRMKAAGRRDPGIAEAARALLGMVQMQDRLLATAVAEASPPVQAHTRVTDAQKVLVLLIARLDRLLTDLGEPRDKAR